MALHQYFNPLGGVRAVSDIAKATKKNTVPSSFVPSDLAEWLANPANKNSPFYQQAQAIANTQYTGPGSSSLDWLYSLFGQTPGEKGFSSFSQYQNDSWRELLGKINEFNLNTPSAMLQREKLAGINSDLTGITSSPLNVDTDNPVSPPDYGGIAGGQELLSGAVNTFTGLIQSALSMYATGVNLKGASLSNDLAELHLQDSVRGSVMNYARSLFQDGTAALDDGIHFAGKEGFANLSLDMGLDDFVKNGSQFRQRVADYLVKKLEEGEFPFSTYNSRNRKRFKEQFKNYVHSDDFAKDMFNFLKSREEAFQGAVKTSSQPIGSSSGSKTFAEGLKAFKPLYKLEMDALAGDYQKRIYQAGEEAIIFDEKQFQHDLRVSSRKILSQLKAGADAGDEFSSYLLFTMCTDPSYFQELNTLAGGIADFASNFLGNLNPLRMLGKLKKGAKMKAPKSTSRTYDPWNSSTTLEN